MEEDKNSNKNKQKNKAQENVAPNLILPYPCSIITSDELATSFVDCCEEALESLSMYFGVEHLSESTNSDMFKYPMAGLVYGMENRFIIPLKVQTDKESVATVVYFVVDPGAPITCFSEKTAEQLFGKKVASRVLIQDTFVNCTRSKNSNELLKDVNLLGSQFLVRSNISTMISPNKFEDFSEDFKVFYLTPFSMIDSAQKLAASVEQSVDLKKKTILWGKERTWANLVNEQAKKAQQKSEKFDKNLN